MCKSTIKMHKTRKKKISFMETTVTTLSYKIESEMFKDKKRVINP